MKNTAAKPLLEWPDRLASPLQKGLGVLDHAVASDEVPELGWNLLREDLSLPAAILRQDRLLHNAQWMQRFIAAYGLKLAPHGKTTMAPRLFDLQLKTGAWGITLATAHQTAVAYRHGVRRVLMANQLTGRANMEIVARLLEDPGFEFFCLVDSSQAVEHLGRFFAARNAQLPVLIELGVNGGRAGVRDAAQLAETLRSLDTWKDYVLLSGVEVYEGVLAEEASVRGLLRQAVDLMRDLLESGTLQRTPALLSGAGSAWYDVVAEEFSQAEWEGTVETVLRPGCYLSHDVGVYREAQAEIAKRNPVARSMREGLLPALEVWAYVQSVPEPHRAIVALGKRDAAFDAGLPTPAWHYRPGAPAPRAAPPGWKLTKMMDQHAYLEIEAQGAVQVGDMIGFNISHPCLTFDKWRCVSVIDSNYDIVDIVPTFF